MIRHTIYKHFCGGENLKEVNKTVDVLASYGIETILDYGVEGKESDKEFDLAVNQQLKSIEYANGNKHVPFVSCKVSSLAKFSTLRNIQKDGNLNETEIKDVENVKHRLDKLCSAAAQTDVAIYIDAEETWIQDGIDRLVMDMMVKYNREKAVVFNTIQLYRHDRLEFLKESHLESRRVGFILGMKLVRGAYMEQERDRAKRKGYPSPIQPDKKSTDQDFDLSVKYCLDHINEISFTAATHNELSCQKLAEQINASGIDRQHKHLHFSQLLGMSDHISYNLGQHGFSVSKYVPYGPIEDVIPYLIRRAEENTSIAGQVSRELSLIELEIKRRKNL